MVLINAFLFFMPEICKNPNVFYKFFVKVKYAFPVLDFVFAVASQHVKPVSTIHQGILLDNGVFFRFSKSTNLFRVSFNHFNQKIFLWINIKIMESS